MSEQPYPMSRRGLLHAMGAGWVMLSGGRALAVPPLTDAQYIDRFVHPDLRPMATAIMQAEFGQAPLATRLPALRKVLAGDGILPTTAMPIARVRLPGLTGQPPVDAIVINAKPGLARPAILHTHGGGFIAGAASAGVASLVALCQDLDCVIVTVDYRLAPEVLYTGVIADTYAGLLWLHRNSAGLGVDASRIAVMGESAGGGHAALLARVARDRGEVPVIFQCLTYPMLDDRTGSTIKVPPHVGRIIWTPADNHFGWTSFLGVEAGSAAVPVAGVPMREVDLAGLPPAFIGVGSLDLFHDEDVDYARRLNDSGVAAELIVVPGAFHTFDLMPAPISQWFRDARLQALRRAFSRP